MSGTMWNRREASRVKFCNIWETPEKEKKKKKQIHTEGNALDFIKILTSCGLNAMHENEGFFCIL
jgi:hypothetical protein